ncbi:MAG: hypothetical protein ACI81L_003489, partial [Verrucomicrobiales bacterium]
LVEGRVFVLWEGFDMTKPGDLSGNVWRTLLDVEDLEFRRVLMQSLNLMDNSLRGRVAEALIAYHVGGELTVDNWAAWDVNLGDIRVEVKASGYVQAWTQKAESSISFSIAPAGEYRESESGYEFDEIRLRRSNVYIFCHHKGSCPHIASEWDFYVVPTRTIDTVCGTQKTIALSSVRSRLGANACGTEELRRAVQEIGAGI